MNYITDSEIESLGITPVQCVQWVKDAFLMKNEAVLPTKIPVHPDGDDFITTMPCLLPKRVGRFGVKVVSRIAGRTPSLKSSITLYDAKQGDVISLMDSDWITDMRTGAVAALSIVTLRRKGAQVYSFMGLGHIGRATLKCLAAITPDEHLTIRLLRYKNQAERFRDEFSHLKNLSFEIVDSVDQLIKGADVVVSAITSAKGIILEDESKFKPGVLLVPVHTRGFQNCDTVFDRIIGDDYDHIKGFQYFNQFREFGEIADVLSGKIVGRKTDTERIIAYNYGIALHDIVFASKIYDLLRK